MTKYVILFTSRDECGIQEADIVPKYFDDVEAAKDYIKNVIAKQTTDKLHKGMLAEVEDCSEPTSTSEAYSIDINFYYKEYDCLIGYDRYTIKTVHSEEE